MKIVIFLAGLYLLMSIVNGFTYVASPSSTTRRLSTQLRMSETNSEDPFDKFKADLQMRWRIFQESKDYGLKQRIANVLAGDYDAEATRIELNELIQSAPCVMFTWEASPSCKQAVKALDLTQASYKNVRLDNPWSTGNVLRAELGKMVGRSSVPFIFIDSKYVGGYDGGIDEDAPGIVDLAFLGTLRPKLESAGALKAAERKSVPTS